MSKSKTFNIKITDSATITGYTISNFEQPEYTGGFDYQKVIEKFVELHVPTSEHDLVALVLDWSRCHWSPKPTNWPGMDILVTYTGGNFTVNLPAGKTRIHDFKRGKGQVWNWSSSCLVTAGVFEEVYRRNPDARTNTIVGNHNGCTQFMSLVDGVDEALYDDCVKSFNLWIAGVGLKARDATTQLKIDAIVKKSIAGRKPEIAARSLKNILRMMTGDKEEVNDRITYKP